MALIEHNDLPPRKREPLPNKEQIKAISDMAALTALETEVEKRTMKITVDLEMQVGDEEWDARARAALTAHRICLGQIREQLRRVSPKPEKPADDPSVAAAKVASKAERATAVAARKAAEAEQSRAKADRLRSQAAIAKVGMLRKLSFHMAFHHAAHEILDADMCAAITAKANASLLAMIEAEMEAA